MSLMKQRDMKPEVCRIKLYQIDDTRQLFMSNQIKSNQIKFYLIVQTKYSNEYETSI